jgi:SAM-dependent methyltransferase
MNSVFKHDYANHYDYFYKDKNYQSECDLIENCFLRYGKSKVHTILDVGCGTGNHSIPLTDRGYQVIGVDISSEMLKIAREKIKPDAASPVFIEGDTRTLCLNKKFDAALMMFAVLGYQYKNDDLLASLHVIRDHLSENGLFIFDVWFGPAVLFIRPTDKVKVIPTSNGKIIRTSSSTLDILNQRSEVHFHVWSLSGDRVINESEEVHTMRYFFPLELEFMLSTCGLTLQSLSAFPSLDEPANETTWNVLGVAQAI